MNCGRHERSLQRNQDERSPKCRCGAGNSWRARRRSRAAHPLVPEEPLDDYVVRQTEPGPIGVERCTTHELRGDRVQ